MRNKRGFTLIELTIAIAISGILFGGGLVSYQAFNKRQTIKAAGQKIKSALRNAQSKSLQGEKPTGASCTTLDGYQVTFTDTAMLTSALCSEGAGPITTVALPENATFDPVPETFLYKVLGQGTDIEDQVVIDISGFEKTYELIVTTSGEVHNNEFVE